MRAATSQTARTPTMSGAGPHGTPIAELATVTRTTAVVDSPGASARAVSQGARRRRAAIMPGPMRNISATATTGIAPGHDVVPGSNKGLLSVGTG